MVDHGSLDEVFHALADRSRRRILERLMQGETTVSGLAAPFDLTLAAVSKHIQVLERARLVQREWRGRAAHISLAAGALDEAERWLEHLRRFWEPRLDALEAMFARPAPETTPRPAAKTRKKKEKPR